jgi:class 3 adenylate cyclase
MTALVHSPTALADADLAEAVLGAVRFVVEKERLRGQIEATSTDAAALPTGFVTLLMTDIEGSTALLRRLGDRYGPLLNDVRGTIRVAVARASGREIDARADEFFAVFSARPPRWTRRWPSSALGNREWPDDLDVRVRVGIHSGRPTADRRRLYRAGRDTTARLCTAAHGGQILLSAATRAAVGNPAPAGSGSAAWGAIACPASRMPRCSCRRWGRAPEPLSTAARRRGSARRDRRASVAAIGQAWRETSGAAASTGLTFPPGGVPRSIMAARWASPAS